MAGHSKWANIKHRKAAQDAKRGKIYAKLIREVTVAVKAGGGPDPDANPRLRLALQNARGQNMPKDTIERAIAKASGAGGENYVETTFEGYGPEGVAVFVEATTDNNTRTVSNVRSYFNKYAGSLGKDGCLQFIFERQSQFIIPSNGLDEDEFTLEAIDAGAQEVEFGSDSVLLTAPMEDFGSVNKFLQDKGIEAQEAGLVRQPLTMKEISDEGLPTLMKLIDALEDDDDVQKVYHNADLTEAQANSL